jgi:hypothetical protein
VSAHVEYAGFLEHQGRIEDATAEYKKALEINPTSKIAQEGLARLKTKS